MLRKGLNLVMLAVLVCGTVFAQAHQPDSLWSHAFGGSGHDVCNALIETADHGYLMAGTTASYGAGEWDMWLVKVDSNGSGEFSRTFGGTGGDFCNTICQTPDSGYVLAGQTWSFGPGSHGVGWIVKVSSTGDSLWSRTWDPGYDAEFYSVRLTTGNGLILAGRGGSITMGNASGCLVRTDALGYPLWDHTYGGSGIGYFKSVLVLSDGSFVSCGTTGPNTSELDGWGLKANSDGGVLWSYAYDAGGEDILNSVAPTSDGGFLMAGSSNDYQPRLWIARMGPDGFWWQIPPPWVPSPYYYGELTTIREVPDGTWMAAGTICCTDNGSDFLLVRTIYGLDFRTYGDGGPQWCYAALLTSDGGYALAGTTAPIGMQNLDFYLLKTHSEFSATVDRFTPSTAEFGLTSHPNPFNAVTRVEFALPRSARVTIRACDVLGRNVGTIADDVFTAGQHSVSWNCADCASGVYFITMQGDGFHLVRKAILLR